MSEEHGNSEQGIGGIIKAMGLVFGDIGTSPIYTLSAIFLLTKPTVENVLGIISLIIWTLILLITIQYAWLAMSLGRKGEGGTIVLRELLVPLLKKGRAITVVTMMTIIGISLFIGDGVITPAISILSAVEGLALIPGLEMIDQNILILIAAVIAIMLFSFQKRGTERVAWTFGPIMVIWFSVLTLTGIISLIKIPSIIFAINPILGWQFLTGNGISGFLILSSVILCATGGEALYADMGHLGREPIRKAWYFIFFALILNYLGQGSFILQNPGAKSILFDMVFAQSHLLYIPFLLLSIAATVIASQAMISGIFSIVYQGINTHILPIMKIDYTSSELRSQIYIDVINWLLLFSILFVMVIFRSSSNLTAAYGLAVNGTMMLTGIMITSIFFLRGSYLKSTIAWFVTIIDIAFLIANIHKIPSGAYWSLIIAMVPFMIIMIYMQGQKNLYKALKPIPLTVFLHQYNEIYHTMNKISGTALFFARDFHNIPPYMALTIFKNNIIYQDNIIISIVTGDYPFGIEGAFKKNLADGLRVYEIRMGYIQVVDVVKLFKEAKIDEKTIFYGIEDIVPSNLIWKIFAIIKRLTPSFVQFYKLPADKIHGVVTRIEM
ncbi:KUP/HAK/KT family potassium transporter [Methanosphaerula palustris]|uniref:Probable potassium transport system protein Kup n=1 Tax=Methanosphaerula palustris (strain ATCC BAA-1556 / DSM 19958 / E1-9c) TaxID=521011 RepID=B8GJI0_METPE|nr:KUP/HAK/KT family potassium transporter [Methanosphaerula palustris]ACL17021.1 K potassium transporter [Methanosphaerula palustris E1-9c]